MARLKRKSKLETPMPSSPLAGLLEAHVSALRVRDYSENTIRNQHMHVRYFLSWCQERGLTDPVEITRPILESYQRYLFYQRKRSGEPLSFRSQHARLVALRSWFRWLTRQNHILHNPASEIELPRLPRRLPRNVLTVPEVEQVMVQPDIHDPIGLRDRAILEVLYSTGMRRMELIHLTLYDLDLERGVILIRLGKGKKDRYVPIGERAAAWVRKYIAEARPKLAVADPDHGILFLAHTGEEINRDMMTMAVRSYVLKAKIGKAGACHLFRHTMATLMHENGADIRFIQEILGHVKLETTQIYTHVSIRTLQQVHAATHPAAMPGQSPAAARPDPDPAAEELFAALDEEAEEEGQD